MLDLDMNDRAATVLEAILEPGDNDAVDSENGEAGGNENVVDAPAETRNDSEIAESIAAETKDDAAPEAEAHPAPIEPPVSWKADAKDKFKALPPDIQQYVLDRESERERGLSKTQQESADARKAADAEREQARAERQAYADRLGAIVDGVANSNPKLQEWRQRDWEKYAREHPLEVSAEQFAWVKAENAITTAQNERQRVQTAVVNEQRLEAHKVLSEKLDFWNDNDKRTAFQSKVRNWGKENGWKESEINGIEDPRALLMARKAMLYDDLMAQQSQIAATKKPLPTGKVLKTQATTANGSGNQKADALARVAAKTGRVDDLAAAVLARL